MSNDKITSPLMTKFEYTRLIGIRAMQISMNAPVIVDTENMIDPINIAKKEIQEKKVPLIIKRKLPNGTFEHWNIRDMIIPCM